MAISQTTKHYTVTAFAPDGYQPELGGEPRPEVEMILDNAGAGSFTVSYGDSLLDMDVDDLDDLVELLHAAQATRGSAALV